MFLLLPFGLIQLGCANLFGPDKSRPVEPGFRHRAATPQDAVPLPADIAHDIASISEGGRITMRRGPLLEEAMKELPTDPEVALGVTEEVVLEESEKSALVLTAEGPLQQAQRERTRGPLGFRTSSDRSGKTVEYVVRRGDTLMKIAFEKHADYLRWREIYQVNRHKMEHYTKMAIGTRLTINNVEYVYIQRDGLPYLIRRGDTLKSIAQRLYGDPERWRDLWKNNPQLIRDPRRIYAGFTLYYSPN